MRLIATKIKHTTIIKSILDIYSIIREGTDIYIYIYISPSECYLKNFSAKLEVTLEPEYFFLSRNFVLPPFLQSLLAKWYYMQTYQMIKVAV